jgi:hypothetical protein
VFTHRSSSHPVQSVGHADLVQGPDGRWAVVYLGARPRGSTPGFHVLGRETFLAGIDWVDGWPVFDEYRFDIPASNTAFEDDFSTTTLDPRWVVADGEPASTVAPHRDGGLRFASPGGSAADLLCTRIRDFVWVADAVFESAGEFRLRLDERHWCGLVFEAGRARAVLRIGDVRQDVGAVRIPTPGVTLRLEASVPRSAPVPFGYAGPDDITLSVDTGDGFVELARLDGRYFSTEVAAGFTGRMLALGSPDPDGRLLRVSYRPTGD